MSRAGRRAGAKSWSPEEMDRLERAIIEGARVQLSRGGTEYIIVPREIRSGAGVSELLLGTTIAGDDRSFPLDEIDRFDVIW